MYFTRLSSKIFFFTLFVIISQIMASEPDSTFQNKPYEYGISMGMLFGGVIKMDDLQFNYEKTNSFAVKGFIDSYLIPKLAVGLYVGYTNTNINEVGDVWIDYYDSQGNWLYDEYKENFVIQKINASILEIGGTLKPRFFINNKITIKPGLGIGYRKFFTKGKCVDESAGLALNGSVEIQYLYTPDLIVFSEIGIITQPYGGKHHVTDMTFGPLFYLGFGIAM